MKEIVLDSVIQKGEVSLSPTAVQKIYQQELLQKTRGTSLNENFVVAFARSKKRRSTTNAFVNYKSMPSSGAQSTRTSNTSSFFGAAALASVDFLFFSMASLLAFLALDGPTYSCFHLRSVLAPSFGALRAERSSMRSNCSSVRPAPEDK